MKYLLSICLIWLNVILICSILTAGCVSELKAIQPQLDPVEGTSVMFVPKGCKIGNIVVPENGIFVGESILIEEMQKERREEEQRKSRQRT